MDPTQKPARDEYHRNVRIGARPSRKRVNHAILDGEGHVTTYVVSLQRYFFVCTGTVPKDIRNLMERVQADT